MTIERGLIARAGLLAVLAVLAHAAAGAPGGEFVFAYLQRAGDDYYAAHRSYTGLTLRDRHRPLAGVAVALRESRVTGRALGLEFRLIERELARDEAAGAAVEALLAQGARALVLDLPREEVAALARDFAGRALLLFNVRHTDDALRAADCSPVLFHTLPSLAMLSDALAQFLASKNWREVLVLAGGTPADLATSKAFRHAARKFGLRVNSVREFELGNDPRRRDLNNVALLTAEADYDVVYLADTAGEFGRYVPFDTQRPRPVVGSEGLTASAWHWTWERHGAPQLNQRFDRLAGRRMHDSDFAAWLAVRVVVDSIARTRSTGVAAIARYLRSGETTFDTYLGAPGSFRPWDNQLRLPVLLHTHNAVIARAPLSGFLHRDNELDTLGADRPESACRLAG